MVALLYGIMHRTTIMLPDELRRRLSEQAHRRGISAGELIRKALIKELESAVEENAFLSDIRLAQSEIRDAAEKHDTYLYGDTP